MKTLYLVHDLSDPAVKRRVDMLRIGGADVILAGFSRNRNKSHEGGFCLGYTKDGAFLQRLMMVFLCCLKIGQLYKLSKGVDLLIARNLEMLLLGRRLTGLIKRHNKDISLVFECLDVHRFLISNSWKSVALVAIERWLVKSCKLIITSSPAFIVHYFKPIANHEVPYLLLENKLFDPNWSDKDDAGVFLESSRVNKNFWVIGWYGALRCQKSLDLLDDLCNKLDGKLKVVLRGRPAYTEFRDFEDQVNKSLYLTFLGEYQYPDDLNELYNSVNFTWGIDFFEEDGNSEWLLPNRIYEGGAFNTIPLYISSTEIAKKLESLDVGVGFNRHHVLSEMNMFFKQLDRAEYSKIKTLSDNIPAAIWMSDKSQCVKLVSMLENLRSDQMLSVNHMYEL